MNPPDPASLERDLARARPRRMPDDLRALLAAEIPAPARPILARPRVSWRWAFTGLAAAWAIILALHLTEPSIPRTGVLAENTPAILPDAPVRQLLAEQHLVRWVALLPDDAPPLRTPARRAPVPPLTNRIS